MMISHPIWPSMERDYSHPRGSRCWSSTSRRGGFTLIELLVVILIILLISAVALPTVIPAISHRQVSDAGRILQGALVGARDSAVHNNALSGIRLLPDPMYNGLNANLQLDPNLPLAYNRIIPIEPAPEYSEGLVSIAILNSDTTNPNLNHFALPYPVSLAGTTVYYPYPTPANTPLTNTNVLMIEESVYDPNTGLPNSPTSWFWNIRVGDKIQINNSGSWYTVVGPMTQTAAVGGNSELFVNVGVPGTQSPLVRSITFPNGTVTTYYPEFLFLVNGQDDNGDGWTDEGWDGVDNDLVYENSITPSVHLTDDLREWENESWQGSLPATLLKNTLENQVYTIQRRPAPTSNARQVTLPTNVVVDMTTWGTTQERSRLVPALNQYTGYVDIMVYPNGSVVPSTIYSSSSSLNMAGSFFHFWLAERSDVYAPSTNAVTSSTPPGPPFLPLPQGIYPALFNGVELKGEYRLVTLFARTGQVTTTDEMQFDPSANPPAPATSDIANGTYEVYYPFLQAQQGARGTQ